MPAEPQEAARAPCSYMCSNLRATCAQWRARRGVAIESLLRQNTSPSSRSRARYPGPAHAARRRAALLTRFHARRVLVVLDGVDEAADLSKSVEQVILDQFVAEGHRVMVTSRYEGVRADLFVDFCIMDSYLGRAAAARVIHTQLGDNEYFDHLVDFSMIRDRHDRIYRDDARAPPTASSSRAL